MTRPKLYAILLTFPFAFVLIVRAVAWTAGAGWDEGTGLLTTFAAIVADFFIAIAGAGSIADREKEERDDDQ